MLTLLEKELIFFFIELGVFQRGELGGVMESGFHVLMNHLTFQRCW